MCNGSNSLTLVLFVCSPQMWRERPLRGARHFCLQGGLALGEAAGPGPRHTGPQRWNHLRHRPHIHLHP